MRSAWWQRLPSSQRREYERSTSISHLAVTPGADFASAVDRVDGALRADDRDATRAAAQRLVNLVCDRLRLPAVAVLVEGMRPHDRRGELHGLYSPAGGSGHDRITVWMRTAKRREVVATRTFLRTLLHEVCHHVDFFHLDLPNSFHTPGFYQRESSLFRVVTRGTALAVGRGPSARRAGPGSAASAPPAAAEAPAEPRGGPSGIEMLRAVAAAITARQKAGQYKPGS